MLPSGVWQILSSGDGHKNVSHPTCSSRTLPFLHQEWSLCLLPWNPSGPWPIKWKWCYVIPKLACKNATHFWVVLLGCLLLESSCHTVRKLKQPEEGTMWRGNEASSPQFQLSSQKTAHMSVAFWKRILMLSRWYHVEQSTVTAFSKLQVCEQNK